LLEYDPDIVEIIQFGSSVYAPEYAGDIDLLVFTKREKDYTKYFDSVNDCSDLSFDIDIVVKEIGTPLDRSLGYQVLGAYNVLYGTGDYLHDSVGKIDPTYEESWAKFRRGKKAFEDGSSSDNEIDRDTCFREAFDHLFHASRLAAMAYLSTDVTRWGKMKKQLPDEYRQDLDEFIRVLHVQYFYNGSYPREGTKEEFNRWCERVEEYIKRLESGGD
jgi:predicted nucleotidyltransferase